ncbi:MAG: hypothetical protein ACNYPE_10555 [Candidatus Azotimanducaceae bacterium WSBS_2022_MAG_OTU7]
MCRGYFKILKVARTIADLSGEKHMAERLISLRQLDIESWTGRPNRQPSSNTLFSRAYHVIN